MKHLLFVLLIGFFSSVSQACPETSLAVGPMNLFADRISINTFINSGEQVDPETQNDTVVARFNDKTYQSFSYLVVVKNIESIEKTEDSLPKTATTYEITKFTTPGLNNKAGVGTQYIKTITIERIVHPPGAFPKGGFGIPQGGNWIDKLKTGSTITSC